MFRLFAGPLASIYSEKILKALSHLYYSTMAASSLNSTNTRSLLSLSQSSHVQLSRYQQHSLSLTEELEYPPSPSSPEPSQPTYFQLQISALKEKIEEQAQHLQTIHLEKVELMEELETLKLELRESRKEMERKREIWQMERGGLVRELEKCRTANSSRSPRSKETHLRLIQDLENDIKALSLRISGQSTPKRSKYRPKNSPKQPNSQLIQDLSLLLSTNKEGIVGSVQHLMAQKASQSSVLMQISALVQQVSPPSAFPQAPTPPQVWDWLSRLVDEYMDLKRTLKSLRLRLLDLATKPGPVLPRELRELLKWGPRLMD